MSKRFWLCGAMTLLSGGVSAFYSVMALWGASDHATSARYAASRSVSLLLLILVSVALCRRASVLTLAWCMSLVQLLDGWIGLLAHDPAKTYGPIAFALVNGVLAYRLWREEPGF